MNPRAVLLAVGCVLAVPAAVSASTFQSARVEVGDADLTLHLEADGIIGRSLVRSEAGRIRVWFHGLADDVRLDPPVEGHALRFIRIRPGINESMVVVFRLSDSRTINPAEVQVLSDGARAFVRIPLEVLPPLQRPEPSVEMNDDTGSGSALTEAAVDEGSSGDETQAGEASSDAEASTSAAESTPSTPLPGASRRKTKSPERSSSAMYLLLMLTVLLAAAYGVIRYLTQRRGRSPLNDIQIVAQKRLGNRHQIVLVRALGEDHLLSVNGQQTQRIASTSSAPDELSEQAADADVLPSSIFASFGMTGRLFSNSDDDAEAEADTAAPQASPNQLAEADEPAPSMPSGLSQGAGAVATRLGLDQGSTRKLRFSDSRRSVGPSSTGRLPAGSFAGSFRSARSDAAGGFPAGRSQAQELEKKNRFGSELLRMALENETRPPITVRPPKGSRGGESEAVAGLLKLRDRLAS